MRKSFVVLMTTGLVLTASSSVLAADIPPTTYDISGSDWAEYSQGGATGNTYDGENTSVHKHGTWNSPYTLGVDGYNYNDPQDYTSTGTQVERDGGSDDGDGDNNVFTSGPHGGYLTSTHRCRECHAVHRAAGKFKLLRSDTRFEACDWCHGTGAGSGFNIQMDNDDAYTVEYNVGHTMGFGVSDGKWKAPDDTYPAYQPNYWMGGFSCFDCHSPHANPQRLLGFNDAGNPVGVEEGGKMFGIANPGHAALTGDSTHATGEPVYLSGSWLLIKNPDREIATETETVQYFDIDAQDTATVTIGKGEEISDLIAATQDANQNTTLGALGQYADSVGWAVDLNDETNLSNKYPVNKIPIDWDSPVGPAGSASGTAGFTQRVMTKRIWNVSEFCTDCHDGNAGLHTVQAPLFSEDRALRDQLAADGGSFDLAYGHDAQPRH